MEKKRRVHFCRGLRPKIELCAHLVGVVAPDHLCAAILLAWARQKFLSLVQMHPAKTFHREGDKTLKLPQVSRYIGQGVEKGHSA